MTCKNVLFISTTFNYYYEDIIKKLESKGYSVDWYSDRPSNTIFTRALIRFNKNILNKKIKRYENKIINEVSNKKYDLVFVVLGQSFNESFWKKLKELQPNAKFIYYVWDSVKNFPCIERNAKFFDKTISFDKMDCERYGYEHLPLFYIDAFDKENINEKYDFCFIGTVKSGRYTKIKNMISQLESFGLKGYTYFYLQSRIVLLYYKLKFRKEFKNVKFKDVSFKLLSKNECASIESESHIIVDAAQPGQNGLTIRVFEALGLKKKILTTNSNICDYDFYNENNVCLYSELDDVKIKTLKSNYNILEEDIRKKYSLENWVQNVLGDDLQ